MAIVYDWSVLYSGYSIAIYEFAVFASWAFLNFLKPWGKSINIAMKQIGGVWFARTPKLVPMRQISWKGEGKEEGHIFEPELTAYVQGGGLFSNPVNFYNVDDSRALIPEFSKPKNAKDKTALKLDFKKIPHDPTGKVNGPMKGSINPSSTALKGFLIDQGYAQAKNANKTNQKVPLGMLILVAIAAGAICFMLAYFLLPPHYVPVFEYANGTAIHTSTGNNAVTSTITSHTTTIINGGTQTVGP